MSAAAPDPRPTRARRLLAPYRRVLAHRGAWRFSLAGFVGRLPISMVSLGIVLLASRETGSYTLAGTLASAYLLSNALLAVVLARLVDRHGQRRVLPAAELGYAGALVLLMWGVTHGWPSPALHLLAAAAGGVLPQVGACVRARWAHVLDDARPLQTAYALEGVVDEALFVVGPTVVAVLATTFHPVVGLSTALACGLAGTLALAAQRSTEPPPRPRAPRGTARVSMPWRTVLLLAAVFAALGAVFGAAEVVTVAFADERGAKGAAGPLLGLWALGSLVAGVVTGAVTWRQGPEVRVRWGVLALAIALLPLVLVDALWVLAVLLLVGGVAIAPTLIAAMALTERTVPRARLVEGMAVLHTGMGVGIAPGAALAGVVVDAHGASAAYLVPAVAGLLGAVAAWSIRRPVPSRP